MNGAAAACPAAITATSHQAGHASHGSTVPPRWQTFLGSAKVITAVSPHMAVNALLFA